MICMYMFLSTMLFCVSHQHKSVLQQYGKVEERHLFTIAALHYEGPAPHDDTVGVAIGTSFPWETVDVMIRRGFITRTLK